MGEDGSKATMHYPIRNVTPVDRLDRRLMTRAVLLVICFVMPWFTYACGRDTESIREDVALRSPSGVVSPPATRTEVPTKTPSASLTPTMTATPACLEIQGRLEENRYTSTILREEVPFLVYLPPCYATDGQPYPTLYLLHGFPFDETHWVELGIVDRIDEAVSADLLPQLIMVMPRAPEPLFTSTDGGPGSYEAEFIEDLIPVIEQTYHTDTRPRGRALGGISRGGVWALEISFRHAEHFDTVAALSPALHVNYARRPYDPIRLVGDDQPLPSAIFLSVGDGEPAFRQATEELSLILEQNGVAHTFVLGSGGHDAAGWISVMDELLVFLRSIWPNPY